MKKKCYIWDKMKKVRFQKIDHTVYDSVEEARKNGITVWEGDWRKALPGSWVKTDESPPKVLQILKRGAFWLMTCGGTYPTTYSPSSHAPSNYLTSAPHEYRYSLSGHRHGTGKKFSAKQKAMVMFFCQGDTVGDLKATFVKVYKRSPGPNEWKMYCNSGKFWEAVSMELKEDMEEAGITKAYLLKKMKDALDSKAVEPKDLFKMTKEALELHEGQRARGSMALFGKFRVEDADYREVGNGEKKKLEEGASEVKESSDSSS